MKAPRILFLDDDPVIRILRLVLSDRGDEPWIRAYFAPELADAAPLIEACSGLRRSDGATVGLLGDAENEVKDATAIVFRRGEVDAALLDANPSVRLVQRLGQRSQGIDLAAARERGVTVSCLPRRTLDFTAEHSLLLMLALAKKLLPADRAVRQGSSAMERASSVDGSSYNWAGIGGATGLSGSTLGIVGMGEVGSLVARLARAFGMNVIYYKPRRATPEQEAATGASYADLGDLLARSDFVSLSAANTPENIGMAGRAFFGRMKRSAYFINTSRGRLVDEGALFEALSNGGIAGAGLDVHLVEPRAVGDRFAQLDNVVLTPHFAGGARSGVLSELAVVARNCLASARGEPVLHEVTAA